MKYITFYRESNDFTDIVSDKSIKNTIDTKVYWLNHLQIGIEDRDKKNEKMFSYIELKFGDSIVTRLHPDYAPIPNVDYTPNRR